MPKMKSHSGAKKRFRVTKTGKIKRAQQNKNHILNKKASKRKMRLRQGAFMASEKEAKTIRTMIQR
ncbi:MAG: 50S ribosomal protein L35 [Clostridiales bacterium]|jgi:large subunit ribosomal protein L35|nr:50S ribosomal protein L35 [Clostridiales bacterium]